MPPPALEPEGAVLARSGRRHPSDVERKGAPRMSVPGGDSHSPAAAVPGTATAAAADKIIIIGGGIAGLACGCYLQMNGFQTEILEAGLLPGGLCTAWHRGPYVFDGCLRWLMGTRPPSAFHQVWQELGAIAGRKILIHDEILRSKAPTAKPWPCPQTWTNSRASSSASRPKTAALIDKLVRAARRCAPLEPPLENRWK